MQSHVPGRLVHRSLLNGGCRVAMVAGRWIESESTSIELAATSWSEQGKVTIPLAFLCFILLKWECRSEENPFQVRTKVFHRKLFSPQNIAKKRRLYSEQKSGSFPMEMMPNQKGSKLTSTPPPRLLYRTVPDALHSGRDAHLYTCFWSVGFAIIVFHGNEVKEDE